MMFPNLPSPKGSHDPYDPGLPLGQAEISQSSDPFDLAEKEQAAKSLADKGGEVEVEGPSVQEQESC